MRSPSRWRSTREDPIAAHRRHLRTSRVVEHRDRRFESDGVIVVGDVIEDPWERALEKVHARSGPGRGVALRADAAQLRTDEIVPLVLPCPVIDRAPRAV